MANAAGQTKAQWQAQNPGTDSSYYVEEDPYGKALAGANAGTAWNAQGMQDMGARLNSGGVDLNTGAGTNGVEDWNQLRNLGSMRDQPWNSAATLSTYSGQQLQDVGVAPGAWNQPKPADDPAVNMWFGGTSPGGQNGLGTANQNPYGSYGGGSSQGQQSAASSSYGGAPMQNANATYGNSGTPAGFSGNPSTSGVGGSWSGGASGQTGSSYGGAPMQGSPYASTMPTEPQWNGGGQTSATAGGQAYNPTTPSYQPQGAADATWWGDPAKATLENAFSQYGGALLNPTNAAQLNASNPYGQQLGGERLGQQAQQLYGSSTNSQNNLAGLTSQINQPSELAQQSGAISGLYGGANNSQGYLKQIGDQLGGPGALEQFAASSLNGTNPYYERLGQQGRAAIDQAAIARGAYGADGTLAALGNYQSGLDSQNFNNMASLQQNAQAAQMQRLGLGGTLSQSADSSALNQGNALAGLYQNMFADRMQGQQLGVTANSAADQSNIARLAGLTSMTNNGDQTTLARLAGQAGLANTADTTGLNYLNSYFNQAGAAQGAGANRVNTQQDRALQEAIAQASLYGGFYGQGGQQSVDAGVGSANAGANAAGLTGQGENSGYQNLLGLASLFTGKK